jgi:transcriptional regulator GlxA family with amidase domain
MRYVKFLELLDWLKHKRGRSLQARNTIQPYSTVDGDRMSEVIDHSMQHYQGRVKLGELAEKVAMTPASFCKFFKRRTGRTYIDFLNEIRIEHACRLLAGSSKMSVAEIAEDSGFSNIANFNRRFKQYKDVTPSHYRRSHKSYSLGN